MKDKDVILPIVDRQEPHIRRFIEDFERGRISSDTLVLRIGLLITAACMQTRTKILSDQSKA